MSQSKALLVGLERYANPAHNLPGLSEDIAAFVRILNRFGISDLSVLRDANATSHNIRAGLNSLVDGVAAGDVCVFYYTGHGVRLPPGFAGPGEGESDGRDQAFVPFEGTTDSLILDNWMRSFLDVRLPRDVFFYGIYDCCYSGQMYKVMSLPGIDADEIPKEVDFSTLEFTGRASGFERDRTGAMGQAKVFAVHADDTLPNSVHVGASEPEKTALVLNINGVRRSVFTWALETVSQPGMTIERLEAELTSKQAERTSHHTPHVASAAVNKLRAFLS